MASHTNKICGSGSNVGEFVFFLEIQQSAPAGSGFRFQFELGGGLFSCFTAQLLGDILCLSVKHETVSLWVVSWQGPCHHQAGGVYSLMLCRENVWQHSEAGNCLVGPLRDKQKRNYRSTRTHRKKIHIFKGISEKVLKFTKKKINHNHVGPNLAP